jgi:hypothetical protein
MELLTIFILGVIILFVIGIVLFVVYSPAETVPSPIPIVTVPGKPTGVSAVGGNAQATISFVAPDNTGGSPITGYLINSSPDTGEKSASSSPYTFTGLTNGTAYTFTVKAVNVVGESAPSDPSNSVTPSATATWKALPSGGSGLPLISDRIFASAKYGNIVYIAGRFASINGVAANNIAAYNTSTLLWSALGGGIGGDTPLVNALAVDALGKLYAAGTFTTAGGVTVNNIAKWDGESWTALGDGLNNTVNALTVDSFGNLYAGGSFTGTFGDTILFNYVAKWDVSTSSWVSLDNVMNNNILALTIDSSGILYAGGNFTTDGGSPGNYVAKCNTSTNLWSPVGGSLNNRVYSLALDSSGNLYAGGSFTYNFDETNPLNYTAKWNGSDWESLGSGMDTEVFATIVDGSNNLYTAGNFTIAGGSSANFVAKWNPGAASWSGLGAGLTTAALTLVVSGTELYVGGRRLMDAQGGPTLRGIGSYGPL